MKPEINQYSSVASGVASGPGTGLKVMLAALIGLTLVLGGSLGVAARISEESEAVALIETSGVSGVISAEAAGTTESATRDGLPTGLWAAMGFGVLLLAAFNARKRREPRVQPPAVTG